MDNTCFGNVKGLRGPLETINDVLGYYHLANKLLLPVKDPLGSSPLLLVPSPALHNVLSTVRLSLSASAVLLLAQFLFVATLNLKEIPYDIKPVSLIKGGGEQHCNEYRDINPMEQVPALHIDGHTLVESLSVPMSCHGCWPNVLSRLLAQCPVTVVGPMSCHGCMSCHGTLSCSQLSIMHYLEETRPARPLMPQDVHKRAKVREVCEVIASGIQPLQNLIVLIYVGEEKKKEWAQHWITRGFRAVEKLLSSCAGKFCVGDEMSLADCCLVPQVFNARRMSRVVATLGMFRSCDYRMSHVVATLGMFRSCDYRMSRVVTTLWNVPVMFHVDLRPFPIILRIDRELENHPAFRAAHPSNQPDCPPEATK
uniref:GST C-terminal domain-containing protein n=1 Tax=Timema douglasi TaxID=61478 RepID=A0A7R8VN66_TIMDO|nr:unnamed protein product [Timema douglasi]